MAHHAEHSKVLGPNRCDSMNHDPSSVNSALGSIAHVLNSWRQILGAWWRLHLWAAVGLSWGSIAWWKMVDVGLRIVHCLIASFSCRQQTMVFVRPKESRASICAFDKLASTAEPRKLMTEIEHRVERPPRSCSAHIHGKPRRRE